MNESIENWAELEFNDVVRLYRKGELLATGIVDGVMPDGSAVWLVQGTFFGRALFLKSDGANAVRVAREDLPAGCTISTKKQGLT
ncbi:hypothetical protein LJR013_003345 [Pseudarthrobacter oxydans]|uniref:hypothetical protein n=1 Tax=Pseudarthrobacter oxydans TaxID=1671 RepID=UPI003ECE6B3D